MSGNPYGDDTPTRPPRHDRSGDWLKEAITAGLELLDVDESLQKIATHVTTKGEWEKGVISPSLTSRTCRLQRVKHYLGHPVAPGRVPHMAVAQGVPNAVSLINMDRGFLAEGLLVAALKASLGDRVLAHAPTFAPRYVDPQTHIVFAGHPDVMVVGEQGQPELVQVKCPSVYKFERVEKMGDDDALQTYQSQMATELFIVRSVGEMLPARNNLVLFAWEHTPKHSKPRLNVVPLDWGPDLDSIPLTVADEVEEDVVRALTMGIWPEAYPEHQWATWPCLYCNYSRLGDYTDEDDVLPKCDDHERWTDRKEATR